MNNRYYTFLILGVFLLASCAKPISNFTYDMKGDAAPLKVAFENESSNADEYEWDFGDGSNATDESPEHTYKSSGNYTVTLKAKKGSKFKDKSFDIFIPAPENCQVLIETDYGNMLIELSDETPLHRDNFVKLVEEGFYDGLLFHRVINGFMIQGGDPDSKNAKKGQPLGSGTNGYEVPAEFVESLIHEKGALCAARRNNPEKKSSGCQFYIVQGKPVPPALLDKIATQKKERYSTLQKATYKNKGGTPQLDGNYTVFGKVVEGLEIIDKIARVKTDARDRPDEDVKMKIRIVK